MASIIYKPHCDVCGQLIDPNEYEIAYQEIPDPRCCAIIQPYKCPHCGAYFDSIAIPQPKKLHDIFEY